MNQKIKKFLAASLAAVSLTGCSAGKADDKSSASTEPKIKNEGDPLKVGSMTDDEGRVLGAIVVKVLEANGYQVESSVGTLQSNTVARDALKQDQLNLAVDYTGRGLMFIKNVDYTKYQKDYKTAFETTRDADKENGIDWLTYAPYSNTDCLWVREKWGKENNIKSIKDLADYFNNGGKGKISAPYEYILQSPTGFPGWEKAYGLKVNDSNLITGITTDPAGALERGDQGIVAAHGFSTAGFIDAYHFRVLEDPQHVAPIFSGAVVSNDETIKKYPELKKLFNKTFASLDQKTITKLNKELEVDGKSEDDIAEEYLKEKGLIG